MADVMTQVFLEHIIPQSYMPQIIQLDNGSGFTSGVIEHVSETLNISWKLYIPYCLKGWEGLTDSSNNNSSCSLSISVYFGLPFSSLPHLPLCQLMFFSFWAPIQKAAPSQLTSLSPDLSTVQVPTLPLLFFLPSHVNNYLPAPKTMDPIASDPTLLFLAIQVHFKQLSRALLDRPLHCDRHYPFSFQALRTSVSVQSLLGSRGHLLQMNGLSSHWVSPPSSFPESSNKELGWSNFSTLVSCSFAFVSFFL